jgi:hypothetical protein
VIVSTPQDIALIDAVKGINMFKKVQVPVSLGFKRKPHPLAQMLCRMVNERSVADEGLTPLVP